MSTDKPIIEVKHLSKVYNIGHEQKSAPGTLTFRDSLTQTLRKPLEIFTGHRIEQEKFWALKDVNFEVNKGDVVGIIGRNGSGKSTLLKVLSRIVEPTEGEITMRGRVASLLEVGTGFHPELTGRENVYFNGAILGMSQKEIRSKFDEIVAFSEVEKFLDTPVKFYSSGMYVRLAFAVAAHLDPDILIVDEVLAVGDAAFQKKCLGKMKDVAGQGRTVLFVSHSMSAVRSLCQRGALMKEGRLEYFGDVDGALSRYDDVSESTYYKKASKSKSHIRKIEVSSGGQTGTLITGSDLDITAEVVISPQDLNKEIIIGFGLEDSLHSRIDTFVSEWKSLKIISEKSLIKIFCTVKDVPLVPGRYFISSSVSHNGVTSDYVDAGVSIMVDGGARAISQRLPEHGPIQLDYSMRLLDV